MNAVGPVAVIAAGIFFGYLVLSGRVQGVLTALAGGTPEASTPGQADMSGASYGSYGTPTTTAAPPTPLQTMLNSSQSNLQRAITTGGW